MLAPKRLVVIGASAGGIDALKALVSGLPGNFAAPICVVLHTSPQSPGVLADILSRAGKLPATSATNRERLEPGHIYVAPPDHHLLIEPGILRVTKGPRENRFRPAIDPLFRSAAQVFGPAVIGVILTGNLDDGTDGLWTIKKLGGCAIVQSPTDALFPSMPQSAIDHVEVDHVVPLADLPSLLVRITGTPAPEVSPAHAPDQLDVEVRLAMEQNPIEAGLERIARPSRFACPECHGVLLELKSGDRSRFRCHTGHAYSLASLVEAVGQGIEEALWNAVRALDEGRLLMTHLAAHESAGVDREALEARVEQLIRHSDTVRKLVTDQQAVPVSDPAPERAPASPSSQNP